MTLLQGRLHSLRDQKFPAHEFTSLDDVVNKFLSGDDSNPPVERSGILAACFGVPGPVREGRLKESSPISPGLSIAAEISKALSIQHVFLIQRPLDSSTAFYGIPEVSVPDKDLFHFTLEMSPLSAIAA